MNFGLFVMELLLFVTSLLLILLVLVQRGRGGGLTGALGGMGGQSAFGSKAGDAFTRITVGATIFWILLSMLTIQFFNPPPKAKTSVEGIGAPGETGDENIADEGTGILGGDETAPGERGTEEAEGDAPANSDSNKKEDNPSGDGSFEPGDENPSSNKSGAEKSGEDKSGTQTPDDDKSSGGEKTDDGKSDDGKSGDGKSDDGKSDDGKSDGNN